MSDNTIIEFPSSKQTPATLAKVIEAMDHWRTNKNSPQEPIPETIWQQIFLLLEQNIPQSRIQAATGITRRQLNQKLMEHSKPYAPNNQSATPSPVIDFCEVRQEKSSTPYQSCKIPATNTLVVEFCRADGRIMKIHTTTDSFAELMKAFFSGN